MKQFFKAGELLEVVLLFVAWRIWVGVFALLGIIILQPFSRDFFGGGFGNYITNPTFWGWSNFDGEHYIAIAQKGYSALDHAFFPLYPLLINYLAPEGLPGMVLTGMAINGLFFLSSLIVLTKLIKLDYSPKVAKAGVLLLAAFPTSFFFTSVYTGSTFLLLTLLSFYFARKSQWFLAGIFGALASGTTIFGIILLPALFAEWLLQKKGEKPWIKPKDVRALIFIAFVSVGLLIYMHFLYKTTGDPLSFYTEQAVFAQGRSSDKIILLPQVFWRYTKMIATVDKTSPTYLVIWLELLSAIWGIALTIYGCFKKVRLSYLVFASLSLILPTLTGNFTSLPRYVLVIFPLFIIAGVWFSEQKRIAQTAVIVISCMILAVQTMMFVTGYWVA